ncbi:TetR/AcrR family transcriptional regulator [Nocardiopsis gilva YIM 90087]|uniref:TetR/AcrR family transcriptional regulator n=1 Tax=Nocardiopsis gilva YIM 90087 TaxID=1235441 RepID=A0A223SCB7_9ACTN|nr:TetR/AcrR family transcriptional regulator [Nocardiopsis gilva]ASU85797.1 TetR/AcrR family transcriptional regulator [Nocardiopsis gilva YIM 90087]
MNAAKTSETGSRSSPRGRIDKRQAILDAAFRVFARDGYGQSCVREIADEARVAKPTVYNHLGDKETLFHEALQAAVGRTVDRSLAALDKLRGSEGDLRATLEEVGHLLLQNHCCAESQALRRLLNAEAARFPDLLNEIQSAGAQRIQNALADRLARLALAKRLNIADPEQASEQFLALLTGPMELRSRLGTRQVPDTELRSVAGAARDTFLLAYAPQGEAD